MSSKSFAFHNPAVVLTRPARPAKRSVGKKLNLSAYLAKNYLAAGLVVATVAMFILYIFGINQSAAKGYEITKQRNELTQLIEENKKLLVRLAEVGSIVQIQQEAAANHLVQITNQEYLEVNQLSQR